MIKRCERGMLVVNFISLFSGGGGAEIGAMMAGYIPVAANEYDSAIAAMYAENIGDRVRVVKMTPRALARFQSFPDWYKLPEKISLACKIIGNACPPLMYEVVARSLTEAA